MTKEFDRVTVGLNSELGKAITEIQDATKIKAPADIVRRALVMYHTSNPMLIDRCAHRYCTWSQAERYNAIATVELWKMKQRLLTTLPSRRSFLLNDQG